MNVIKCVILLNIYVVTAVISNNYDECGKSSVSTGLVFGGTNTKTGQWPWTARLAHKTNEKYLCGATVISKKHVLSAAHCIFDIGSAEPYTAESIRILLGGYDILNTNEWTVRDVTKITLHPDWKKTYNRYDADLSILEMDNPVTFSDRIRRICLPPPGDQELTKIGSVVGYGITENGTTSQFPQHIEIPTINTVLCLTTYPDFARFVSPRMFCAGAEGKIPCHGDSGNGFFEKDPRDTWTIYGIVSSSIYDSETFCNSSAPTAFTSVPRFSKWIQDTISTPSRCTETLNPGTCDKEETKYYYNFETRKCRRFYYTGCGGNENRFDSMTECESTCKPKPDQFDECTEFTDKCKTIECQFGIIKSSTGCEKCECLDPCAGHSCPGGSRCVPARNGTFNYFPKCRQVSKPGLCRLNLNTNVANCRSECTDDADCSGGQKCCSQENCKICSNPSFPPSIELLSSDELNPVSKEDASVTLKCNASGDPTPTITWTHDGVKLEPEIGRFVLPSSGDLQILNLNMADAGKYICTASNGVERGNTKEFHLSVHQVVRGEKKNLELNHLVNEKRTFYTFEPFVNTTIDTRTHEIASDRDEKIQAFNMEGRNTIPYLPIKIDRIFPNLMSYNALDCSVKEIRKENFKNLRQLERLDLTNNKIASIDKDVFEDLVALRALSLRRNKLTWLNEETFNHNQALEELYLDQNKFESLPAKLLQNLRELKLVNFRENKMKTIDVNFFASSVKLEWIWLYDNKIEYLHADTFQGLNLLKNVDLGRNKCIDTEFGEYQGTTFEDLSKLNSEVKRLCSKRD